MSRRSLVLALLAVVLAALVAGCADSKEVNAAFSRTRVSWYVFDPAQTDALRALPGFDQPQNVTWKPRPEAVFASDVVATGAGQGAVAVSHLGLLVLDDSSGLLSVARPGAALPLEQYQTDVLFLWQGKTFLTLRQSQPLAPPVSLLWWVPGQARLAPYPVPSQVRDAKRQAATFTPPTNGLSTVAFTWKAPAAQGWMFESTSLDLSTGTEILGADERPAVLVLDPALQAVRGRLAERVGAGVPTIAARGGGPLLVFTAAGWVSVGQPGESQARLYRLPDLGLAGRYTAALALNKGFVFTWETSYRGYVGAAGVVHVPYAVLAP